LHGARSLVQFLFLFLLEILIILIINVDF
jgi:hypothetical protein